MDRISCAGELLAHIRTVKMYSWDKLFTQRLNKRRELEVKHLAVCSCLLAILKFLSSCIFGTRTHRCFFSWQTRKYLDAWCVYFWATTPTLFSLFTFSIFAIMGHSLDAATVKQYLELYVWNLPSGLGVWQKLHTFYSFLQVFTCVALFNTLISPLNSLPWVINGMIDVS